LMDSYRPLPIWPLAYRQGHVAGCNMAGYGRAYDGGFPMNAISVCDVPTISVGIIEPPDDGDRYEILDDYDREKLTYKKLVLRGHRLVGALFINEIDRAGIYTGLIRDQVDISQFKDHLLSGSFGLISLPKDYRKHLVVGSGIEV
jgi:NAD(P)H-nitrite reductase large subunit